MIKIFLIEDDRTLLMSKKKRGDRFSRSSTGSSGCVGHGKKEKEKRVKERVECHPPNNHAKHQQQKQQQK